MNQISLADVINWVGVVVGVVGAVVVAPSGFSELLRQMVAGVRRLLPSKPKKHVVTVTRTTIPSFKMRGYAHVGMPEALAEHELLHYLEQRVDELSKTMLDVEKKLDERYIALTQQLWQVELGGRQSEAAVRKLISDAEVQSAQLNARGLPLIAVATVMTSSASMLAECVPFGWVCVGSGISLTTYGVWPWRDRLFHRLLGQTSGVPH